MFRLVQPSHFFFLLSAYQSVRLLPICLFLSQSPSNSLFACLCRSSVSLCIGLRHCVCVYVCASHYFRSLSVCPSAFCLRMSVCMYVYVYVSLRDCIYVSVCMCVCLSVCLSLSARCSRLLPAHIFSFNTYYSSRPSHLLFFTSFSLKSCKLLATLCLCSLPALLGVNALPEAHLFSLSLACVSLVFL